MLKLNELKKEYFGMYRAKVLDNNDPLKYGRIRAEVYPFFKGLVAAEVPWAVPAMPLFEGGGLDGSEPFGAFIVPKVNTFVFVFFEEGDPRQPVYFAEAQTAAYGLPTAKNTNYPDRKVWKTKNGIQIYIDDAVQEIRIDHPTGTNIEVKPDGNVEVHTVKDIILDEDGGSYIKIQNDSRILVHGVGQVIVESNARVDINP